MSMQIWNQVKAVPAEAQKKITGGRLRGFTDINPQWRLAKMTEVFGPIGIGWYYKVITQWIEEHKDEVAAFTNIELFVKVDGEWSQPIFGNGGSMLAAQEKNGIYVSDEAFKMSLTDALSVAMKQLGVGSDVYSNNNDWQTKGSVAQGVQRKYIDDSQVIAIDNTVQELGVDLEKFLGYMGVTRIVDIPASDFNKAMQALAKKRGEKNA